SRPPGRKRSSLRWKGHAVMRRGGRAGRGAGGARRRRAGRGHPCVRCRGERLDRRRRHPWRPGLPRVRAEPGRCPPAGRAGPRGEVGGWLGLAARGVVGAGTREAALARPADVLVDFTSPDSVKQRTLEALSRGVRVVVGTSGLTAADFQDIERQAAGRCLGVIAAGNFSLTAALAKHFALLAAKHLPSWEVIDYAHAEKPDAPSGTTRELAEALGQVAQNRQAIPVERTHGEPAARGASVAGTQVHS